MQINVAQLLKEGTGAARSYDIEGTVCSDDNQEYQIEGKVGLTRAARGILVQGTFTFQTKLVCSRCLDSLNHSSTVRVEEMFYPSIDILSGQPVSLPDDDSSSFMINEHHILDMSEMIRQYCLLALPMKPLCRADCAGLCPECGANINKNRCHCARSARTALAAALKEAESRRKLG